MFGYKLPDDFLIGTANAAFQCEGAWDKDGKSESWMDTYAKKTAGKPHRWGFNFTEDLPDRGCFFYDNYEAYIEDMAKTGQNVYRFSIAWPRVIPTGVGEVNPKGIEFYNKVIDKLLEHNITPFVDIYHWDLPQCLDDIGGFTNPQFPEWYEAYAKVCFENFGDRVKMWSTFNEAQISIHNGYFDDNFPPFHRDMKEYMQASVNCILAHFRAVRLYKSMNLGGKIGMVNAILAVTPKELTDADHYACSLHMDNYFNWWTQPAIEGTLPQGLLDEVPELLQNLPENYQQEFDKWFMPMDFIGLNYYMSKRTYYRPDDPFHFRRIQSFYSAPGQQFEAYPAGLFDVVQYVSERYPGVDIYITENGCAIPNQHDAEKICDDPERIFYLREHLRMCARAIRCGYTNLKGYFYWNDADSYEQMNGYNLLFGLTYVNHETGERRWKNSRHYFSKICKTHRID